MNTTHGEAVVAELGEGNAIFIKADVSKWEENVRFFKTAKEKFGRIDFGNIPNFALRKPGSADADPWVCVSSCCQCGDR